MFDRRSIPAIMTNMQPTNHCTSRPSASGAQARVANNDTNASGRFVYYVPGAHGGSDQDGSPLVQFDTRTKKKKVLALLHPFYSKKYGITPKGMYSVATDPSGERVFITSNVSRGGRAWDCCALTVMHVPESER